jgi:hypothetical protein
MDQQDERTVRGKEQMPAQDTAHDSTVPQRSEDLKRRRREKIQERLAAALDSTDTLQACMAPVTCDLLELLQDLKHGIDESFALGPMALERSEKLRPAIELYARLASQVYKLARLEHSIAQPKEKG